MNIKLFDVYIVQCTLYTVHINKKNYKTFKMPYFLDNG